jgi:hypothetical protein
MKRSGELSIRTITSPLDRHRMAANLKKCHRMHSLDRQSASITHRIAASAVSASVIVLTIRIPGIISSRELISINSPDRPPRLSWTGGPGKELAIGVPRTRREVRSGFVRVACTELSMGWLVHGPSPDAIYPTEPARIVELRRGHDRYHFVGATSPQPVQTLSRSR